MSALDDRILRGRTEYGDKWDASALLECESAIRDAYNHGNRVKVQSPDGWTRTGTVSTTTGWKPAFMLMHRSNSHSSWDLLGASDKVIAVKHARKYMPIVVHG